MYNKNTVKTPMPEQSPKIRNQNFEEVTLGYTKELAREEANRCIGCKQRFCVAGCPVNVPIPEFIDEIKKGNLEEAYRILTSENTLPAICGRVCPQENQCEGLCIRGKKGDPVAIGRLERFVADYALSHPHLQASEITPSNGIKVAVIGAGPAGLTCASELNKYGYDVTLFEALHQVGGVLVYGIPEFRLPKRLVEAEVQNMVKRGVTIQKNVVVGKSITIDELLADGYEAVFIGSGAGLPNFMGLEGEGLNGVYSANEFLTRSNLMKAYTFPHKPTPIFVGTHVAVIGGGNVAMDAARTAKRLGAENVYIVYRRGEDELPARLEEIHHAKEEGITFKLLCNPTKILGKDGYVNALECVEMLLGEPDDSGRRRPIEKPDSTHYLPVDTVVIAIGQSPNPLIQETSPDLKVHKWGGILVDEQTMATSQPFVYAGGDVVTGAATVILAMGAGKKAAQAIHEKLQKNQ